ncbi:MAG TPA: hypothetical protein HPP83_10805 [Candidatus Hydrogenedentes bacterium]|nr:hypothetical protein [Candidatus Hydrogenedentota bacterium]
MRETAEVVRRQLDRLDSGQCEILMLRYYAGKRVREAAAILEIKPDAAAKRLQRAREALGANLMDALGRTREGEERTAACVSKITGIIAITPAPLESAATVGSAAGVASALGGLLVMKKTVACTAVLIALFIGLRSATPNPGEEVRLAEPRNLRVEDAVASRGEAEPERQETTKDEETEVVQAAQSDMASSPFSEDEKPGGGIITGRVYDADTGEGIPHAIVYARNAAAHEGKSSADPDGHYRIAGLAETEYTVRVDSAEGYRIRRIAEDPTLRVAVGFNSVSEGIDFALSKGISIRGRVVDLHGRPIADACVRAWTCDNRHWAVSVYLRN